MLPLLLAFAGLSLLAVGGGVAVLPEMLRVTTVEHHWLSQTEFLQLYSLAQLAPGPNGIVVFLVGGRVAGWPGALAATAAFFLPASILTFACGRLWRRVARRPWAQAARHGLAPVTIGLMLAGAWGLGRSAIVDPVTAVTALLVAAAVAFKRINPALLILGGGLLGALVDSLLARL